MCRTQTELTLDVADLPVAALAHQLDAGLNTVNVRLFPAVPGPEAPD